MKLAYEMVQNKEVVVSVIKNTQCIAELVFKPMNGSFITQEHFNWLKSYNDDAQQEVFDMIWCQTYKGKIEDIHTNLRTCFAFNRYCRKIDGYYISISFKKEC